MELRYTSSVDLTAGYYKKADIDNLLANKVSTTGGAIKSSNLTINGDLDSSKKLPLDIKSSTTHTEFWTLASFHQGIENSGSWLQFSRGGTSNTWQAGMSSDNSYVIRASDATNRVIVNQNGDTTIGGNLDVGVGAASSLAKAHVNHAGSTGHIQMEAEYRNQSFLSFGTTYVNGYIFFEVKNAYYMYCGGGFVHFYKPTSNVSDDRLKENEELIENACETLSKLRPQLYDKKNQIWKTMTLHFGIEEVV